jgi:hypothetical protein
LKLILLDTNVWIAKKEEKIFRQDLLRLCFIRVRQWGLIMKPSWVPLIWDSG